MSGSRVPGAAIWTGTAFWFALMATLGGSGALRRLPDVGPLSALQLSILIPPVAFVIVARTSDTVRGYVRSLDPTWLAGIQVMRILGCSHLVSWGLGLMAGGFALPVGLGNLGVSLVALSILPGVAARTSGWERRLKMLSVLGLCEFAMTVGLAIVGFLAMATPMDPPMALDRYASIWRPPISIFPTFLIPFFSVLHLATLERLRG